MQEEEQRHVTEGKDETAERTCPSIGRLTVHELASGEQRPCPKAIGPDPDDPSAPMIDGDMQIPCCFDCQEFEFCGNGDPKYSAFPCVNDLCPLVSEDEYRRIVHCKMQYTCQLMEALKKATNAAGEFAMSVNEQMLKLGGMAKRKERRAARKEVKATPSHPALTR